MSSIRTVKVPPTPSSIALQKVTMPSNIGPRVTTPSNIGPKVTTASMIGPKLMTPLAMTESCEIKARPSPTTAKPKDPTTTTASTTNSSSISSESGGAKVNVAKSGERKTTTKKTGAKKLAEEDSTKGSSATARKSSLTVASKTTSSRVLGEAGLKDLRTAFHLLDKNSDGHISISEFQAMLKNFGISVPDIHVIRVVERASSTGKRRLSEEDFLKWISAFLENDESQDEDLLAAFQVFDKDNNGYITKDELKQAMELIGEVVSDADLNEMLDIADVDKDGQIDYGEFARLLT